MPAFVRRFQDWLVRETVPTGTVVCILGMHRSGTSSLAGCLQEAGLELGEVVESAPFNLKGNRENLEVRALNDDVLAYSNGAWDVPPDNLRWTRIHRDRRRKIIAGYDGIPMWGFKDPRTVLTLPFWRRVISTIQFVGTYRHPMTVARSLASRNHMSIEKSLSLWRQYNERILRLRTEIRFPIVSFDLPPDEYRTAVRLIGAEIGLEFRPDGPRFFDSQLRNQFPNEDDDLPGDVLTVLHGLQEISDSGANP